jgi:hypothetical protein
MRQGAVIPFSNKYLFVYPSGQIGNRTIYYGDYSDELTYACTAEKLEILVERFYSPTF